MKNINESSITNLIIDIDKFLYEHRYLFVCKLLLMKKNRAAMQLLIALYLFEMLVNRKTIKRSVVTHHIFVIVANILLMNDPQCDSDFTRKYYLSIMFIDMLVIYKQTMKKENRQVPESIKTYISYLKRFLFLPLKMIIPLKLIIQHWKQSSNTIRTLSLLHLLILETPYCVMHIENKFKKHPEYLRDYAAVWRNTITV